MFPLVLIAALGAIYFMSKKPSTINAAAGDVYRIRVQVPDVQDKVSIEGLYRMTLNQIAQIGYLTWEGNVMTIQLQYLRPSTITLGEMRAGTTTIRVLGAELVGRGAPPVVMPPTPAVAGAVARRAIQSGEPAALVGAAAVAEQAGAVKLSRALARAGVAEQVRRRRNPGRTA